MRIVLWVIMLAFGAYSLWAMVQVGYLGIWQGGFSGIGATQVTLDLLISSVLLIGFVVRDARATGRSWWPYALITLVGGSFGTLAYLLWPSAARGISRAAA